MEIQSGETFLDATTNLAYKPTSDERTMAILAHLLGLFVPIFGSLVIYLIKKDESRYVAAQAKEALNFQITAFIVCVGLAITLIGILLIWVVSLAALILIIIATIKASDNLIYRYPFTLRLIK
ncbi:MAG: DUF4870 domain-containing protein [Chitinophagaceae bacterium]